MVLWDVVQQTAVKKILEEQQGGQRLGNLLGMHTTLRIQLGVIFKIMLWINFYILCGKIEFTQYYSEQDRVTRMKRKGLLNERIRSPWSLTLKHNALLKIISHSLIVWILLWHTCYSLTFWYDSWLHLFQHPKITRYNKCCIPILRLPIKYNIPIYTADSH